MVRAIFGVVILIASAAFIGAAAQAKSLKEQLVGIFHGKIEGVTLDGWVTGLETYGFGGKVVGICLRAIAGVFGILRP